MSNTLDFFKPEYLLSKDAFVGSYKTIHETKLKYLSEIAKEEQWNFTEERYKGDSEYPILNNYLFFTYDRLKEENKLSTSDDGNSMCFNTGLQTRKFEKDIYAYFEKNINRPEGKTQEWKLLKFCTDEERLLSKFKKLPEIAEYCDKPAELIYDKNLEIRIDYEHIVVENISRFREIGLDYAENVLTSLLKDQADKAINKVKRNYKVAIPQYYADPNNPSARIQLLLPLCFSSNSKKADLALVISKEGQAYIGKTILHLDWAYMNSRRIVTPDAEWVREI